MSTGCRACTTYCTSDPPSSCWRRGAARPWRSRAPSTGPGYTTTSASAPVRRPPKPVRRRHCPVPAVSCARVRRVSAHSGRGKNIPTVLALDCHLSLRVENVKPGRAHGNAQLVAHLHPRGRLDARHHDTLADLHIEQDFRAELLDHLNHSIEARVAEISATRHGEVLRPHTEYDLAPDMAAQALRDLVRQLDAQAGVLGDQRSVRLGHRN